VRCVVSGWWRCSRFAGVGKMNILDYFGGSRAAITLGCGIATTLLCYFGKVSGEVYATVTIATVAAYIGGRTTESIKQGQ